jgi:hypothetical protein
MLAITKNARAVLILAIRIVGGIVAASSFLVGVWTVFTHPARGLGLMGFGIVAGVIFGRVPAGSGRAK